MIRGTPILHFCYNSYTVPLNPAHTLTGCVYDKYLYNVSVSVSNLHILVLLHVRVYYGLTVSACCQTCGGTLTATSGQIASPDFNNGGIIEHRIECEWTIEAEGKTIELHIVRTDIHTTADYYATCYYQIWVTSFIPTVATVSLQMQTKHLSIYIMDYVVVQKLFLSWYFL